MRVSEMQPVMNPFSQVRNASLFFLRDFAVCTMSKQDKMRTDAMATAMNVLKGAIQKVLATPVTAHIQYVSKTKGT